MYTIDQNSKTPLHIQLYEALKNDIVQNLKVGEKLPSIRKLSSTYNLSKNTVESAFRQLYVEGFIESYPKSGYFVSDTNFKDFRTSHANKEAIETTQKSYKYDFFPARLPKDSFPLKLWKRIYTKVIDETLDLGGYPDGQGEYILREQIAEYLNNSRGANCIADQIIVTSGFGESMGLLAKMLKSTHDTFAMEDPGYHIVNQVFSAYGYEIEKIGVDENGLMIDALQKSKAKLVYITPSHQYPKGVSMPIANRLKLLEWAKDTDALILEDDYDGELTYYNRPIPSLQGLDKNDKVVYFGTFSKYLSPALRVSYMVVPQHLLGLYKTHFDSHFCKVSLDTQITLAHFMKEGHFDKHIRKIRTLHKKKHELLKKLLEEHLGETMKIEAQGAGLAIIITPAVAFDWEKFKILAEQEGIKLYFAKGVSGGSWEALRLGFGGFSEKELYEAVEILSKLWRKALLN
ncbi:PLP-dependent aminotransferase family protein [Sulfurimonas sp.]|uniref:MocR-like pyridoxine biosynthesis transcription factor PdxR n=1 Tax=Sulfurimonas sp. TaxID=2022749 RepID=UPI003D100129